MILFFFAFNEENISKESKVVNVNPYNSGHFFSNPDSSFIFH